MNYQEQAHALFEDQKRSWPLLGANWAKLGDTRLRHFDFDGITIQVQFNPRRIISSSARVDKVSVGKRPCFLCAANRPPEEQHVWFQGEYEILCNPFPIFREHFTISRAAHTPQVIAPEFSGFLDLARELPDLVVFYNAPGCGASAPDHMHFQAGSRGFMPLEAGLGSIKARWGESLIRSAELEVTAVQDGLRRFVVIEGGRKGALEGAFGHLFEYLKELQGGEPMINMLACHKGRWQVLVFPREKHRPRQYFEEGEGNILLSPAAVDMGGVLITPLEKDFLKITAEDVRDIFAQVSFSGEQFRALGSHLKTSINSHG